MYVEWHMRACSWEVWNENSKVGAWNGITKRVQDKHMSITSDESTNGVFEKIYEKKNPFHVAIYKVKKKNNFAFYPYFFLLRLKIIAILFIGVEIERSSMLARVAQLVEL